MMILILRKERKVSKYSEHKQTLWASNPFLFEFNAV